MVEISRTAAVKGSGAVGGTILPVDELYLHTPASKVATQEKRKHAAPSHAPPPPAAVDLPTGHQQTAYLFFDANNAAFHEAVVARLILKGDEWVLKPAPNLAGSRRRRRLDPWPQRRDGTL